MGSRADGTNPRALGTNPRATRGIYSKGQRRLWNPRDPGNRTGLPRWLRFEVLKRDGFRCTYCGTTPKDGAALQIDHIKPKAAGGSDEPVNLTTACADCNGGKAARKLSERLI